MINPSFNQPPIGGNLGMPPMQGDPSLAGLPQLQPPPPPMPPVQKNFVPTLNEQQDIVNQCNTLKKNLKDNASQKKNTMRQCYAYANSQFSAENNVMDLLPLPSSNGGDRDIQSNRPKVFVPLSRQQLKTLYSYLKLIIFPDDEDYFRIRATDPYFVPFENDLTEAYKQLFDRGMISEKMGKSLYNAIWAGNAAEFPTIEEDIEYEWNLNPMTGEYEMTTVNGDIVPSVEALNPIDFYPDPTAKDPEKAKWGYFTNKKLQQILDSDLYFNRDRLDTDGNETVQKNRDIAENDLSQYNQLNQTFTDSEKNIDYDLFYFPYLKTKDGPIEKIYRNMLVGIAAGRTLVRFAPNTYPKGMNPVVFFNWMPNVDTLYGTGPIEDIKDLQREINIMRNYMIEVLARIGNRFIVTPKTDITNLFGIAGGVMVDDNPRDIQAITGDYAEIQELQNTIGTTKAEAQITSGSQNPFQGSSNIDFKKTATELQILSENAVSVMREIVQHITVTGTKRTLKRLMYLCAQHHTEPVTIRQDNQQQPDGSVAPSFNQVDLSIIMTGKFEIELVNVNPSQSKQAQINSLMQITNMAQNPEAFFTLRPLMEKVGQLMGITDIKNLLDQISEAYQGVIQQQQLQQQQQLAAQGHPGVPGGQGPPGHDPNGGMAGGPPPVA